MDGINAEKLAWVMELKNVRRGRISEYAEHFKGAKYLAGKRPWGVPCDLAFPSATQNEIDDDDARHAGQERLLCVSEGANMPSTPEAVDVFLEAKILYGPGKAANAGGVAVSGLEMTQNAGCMRRSREDVDRKLRDDHAVDPRQLRQVRPGERVRQLRPRREQRRLHQGGRRDGAAGLRVMDRPISGPLRQSAGREAREGARLSSSPGLLQIH